MEKDYFVPFASYGEDKFEEKRSKFTGRLWHVETAEEAVAKIKEMRETYWDDTQLLRLHPPRGQCDALLG